MLVISKPDIMAWRPTAHVDPALSRWRIRGAEQQALGTRAEGHRSTGAGLRWGQG